MTRAPVRVIEWMIAFITSFSLSYLLVHTGYLSQGIQFPSACFPHATSRTNCMKRARVLRYDTLKWCGHGIETQAS
ncbi:hypothetical protein F5B17DRAFT_246147 [Nemania serpens]|nr:hypothetical protein F5B17DRAFT_246147 [Nemania serpens]